MEKWRKQENPIDVTNTVEKTIQMNTQDNPDKGERVNKGTTDEPQMGGISSYTCGQDKGGYMCITQWCMDLKFFRE